VPGRSALTVWNTYGPTFYDMLLHIGTLMEDDASRIIAETAYVSFARLEENLLLMTSRQGRSGLLLSLQALPALFDERDGAGGAVFAIQLRVPAGKTFVAQEDVMLQALEAHFPFRMTGAFSHIL
jgi:hypothetical protein